MAELVKIPLASAEYVARFVRPWVGFIGIDRPRAFDAIVTALLPFQLRISNAQISDTGTLAEWKTIFKLPERGITFQFGAEEIRFSKEGSSWSTAPEDIRVLQAAENALMEIGRNPAFSTGDARAAVIESCTVSLNMHLQLLHKSRDEVLSPFLPEAVREFAKKRGAQRFGGHLFFVDGDIFIDSSLAYANGIFLRVSTQFKGRPAIEEMLAKVRADEDEIFRILDIEEEVNG